MFGCKCVSVTAMISNPSVKLLRKSNLFRALRIFMLQTQSSKRHVRQAFEKTTTILFMVYAY